MLNFCSFLACLWVFLFLCLSHDFYHERRFSCIAVDAYRLVEVFGMVGFKGNLHINTFPRHHRTLVIVGYRASARGDNVVDYQQFLSCVP